MRSPKEQLLELIDRMSDSQIRLVLSFIKQLFEF